VAGVLLHHGAEPRQRDARGRTLLAQYEEQRKRWTSSRDALVMQFLKNLPVRKRASS
jgi:hypothetical protein